MFLCDTAKRFNREDLNGNTLLHSELGFACVRRDFELMKTVYDLTDAGAATGA